MPPLGPIRIRACGLAHSPVSHSSTAGLPVAEVGWNANWGGVAGLIGLPPTALTAVTRTYSVLVVARGYDPLVGDNEMIVGTVGAVGAV